MKVHLSRKAAALLGGGVLALGGAGAALAASQGSSGSPRRAYLDSVAKHLGVAPGSLSAAIRAADIERVDAALAAGRITKAQAERMKRRFERAQVPPFLPGRPGAQVRRGRQGRSLLRVAADYLGTRPAALRAEREHGTSLAKLAESTPGKSVQGLTRALTTAIEERLDAAVAKGLITTAREQEVLARVSTRIEALLHRTGPPAGARTSR